MVTLDRQKTIHMYTYRQFGVDNKPDILSGVRSKPGYLERTHTDGARDLLAVR